jgi:hypothetical protein
MLTDLLTDARSGRLPFGTGGLKAAGTGGQVGAGTGLDLCKDRDQGAALIGGSEPGDTQDRVPVPAVEPPAPPGPHTGRGSQRPSQPWPVPVSRHPSPVVMTVLAHLLPDCRAWTSSLVSPSVPEVRCGRLRLVCRIMQGGPDISGECSMSPRPVLLPRPGRPRVLPRLGRRLAQHPGRAVITRLNGIFPGHRTAPEDYACWSG